MKTKRINLISGPRNISTALMYSFANRPDTEVVDEPMYAYYLEQTGIRYHPSTDKILKSQPRDIESVKSELIFQQLDKPIYFIKGMAHHYVNIDLSFLIDLKNILLIRDPHQLIASFTQVIEFPTIDDIGLKREWEIFCYLSDAGHKPIVLDSNDVLVNPADKIEELCSRLEIPFSHNMLTWESGPIIQDGVWAEHWYENVWKSTGFERRKTSARILPDRLNKLYKECLMYYNLLKSQF